MIYLLWPSMGKMCDSQFADVVVSRLLIVSWMNLKNIGSRSLATLKTFSRLLRSQDSSPGLPRLNRSRTRVENRGCKQPASRGQRLSRLLWLRQNSIHLLLRQQLPHTRSDGFRCCYFSNSLLSSNLNFVSCRQRTNIIYKQPQH